MHPPADFTLHILVICKVHKVLPSLALLFFERKVLGGVVMKFQLNVFLRPVPTNFSCTSPVVPRSLHISHFKSHSLPSNRRFLS
jgi:hypothetical protein